jgi:hypothetical protein
MVVDGRGILSTAAALPTTPVTATVAPSEFQTTLVREILLPIFAMITLVPTCLAFRFPASLKVKSVAHSSNALFQRFRFRTVDLQVFVSTLQNVIRGGVVEVV